jgi:hypothetical protein
MVTLPILVTIRIETERYLLGSITMIPKLLNKLPAIITGRDQLYIPMAPPLAHVGYLCGGVNVVC